MADEDEIDILGDFSFNSCLAQNNQGIPSCSNREDTVHPQWLLDSIANNWYDTQSNSNRAKDGPSRKLSGHSSKEMHSGINTTWNQSERDLLVREMAKYGRNIRKISQTIKTKTEAEIQALIEAEYGVNLETPSFGLDKNEDCDDIPAVVQEEIIADDIPNVLNMVTTGSPTINVPRKPFRKKSYNVKPKKSLLRPDVLKDDRVADLLSINPSEIFYDDDLIIGSTESIGSELDLTDVVSRNVLKQQIKIGNHRRKVSRNYDRGRSRNRSKDPLKTPPRRQRKDSSLSEDSAKSPKMQIVFSSGQALPVSEGEQVIKIEKKKDSEPESDIEIDIDSDTEGGARARESEKAERKEKPGDEVSIAVPLRKFEPMPKRQKRINLDGGGGYTIMHTESGDLYAVGAEPRKERAPRRPPAAVQLVPCRTYTKDRPAPYEVRIHVSALIAMDAHAHSSRAEVMGLAGGRARGEGAATEVLVQAYRPAAAAACGTHCDMDPVSQALAAESLRSLGLSVCAWHHSHPTFPPSPSALDLRTQRALQRALERARAPLLGLVTSQHWPPGRTASQYRCIRVEDSDTQDSDEPIGYQFSVKLVADLTETNLRPFLCELRAVLREDAHQSEYSVDMARDVCPQAGITYLEKCLSSISHHLHSAGYEADDAVATQLLLGVRDIFR